MSDIAMEKQRIENRTINYISVSIHAEEGAEISIDQCEYSTHIMSIIGALDISVLNGSDDISLINECVDTYISENGLRSGSHTNLILKESGEWQDVFWHKYYEVERVCINTY